MNDEFLRRLRPMPRAAFVHELKARLDRLPRERSVASGPLYLRTLLIALLIGGAAFAVTMMSMRRDLVVAGVNAPVSRAEREADKAQEIVASASAARSSSDELTPAIPRAARRESIPSGRAEGGAAQQERPAPPANGAGTRAASHAPSSQIVAGIAVAGQGIRRLNGAGAASSLQIMREWSLEYEDRTGVWVDYRVAGSGGGLKLLQDRALAFAVVEGPVSAEELQASGLFQFPMVATGAVPIVRLDDVAPSQIRLDGLTLARMFLGEITRWNDPVIQKLNPGIRLPGTPITLTFRQDEAASTLLLTDYLARSSSEFNGRYGVRRQIDVSPGAAARGDDGVADFVERTDGAIGYVDYLYAKRHGIESIRLINKEGRIVSATPGSLQSALIHADWLGTPGFGASLTDVSGDVTWPMTSALFVVVRGRDNRPNAAATVQFFDWAYLNGSQTALELGYIPLPLMVADRVRETWAVAFAKGAPPESAQRK